MKMKRFLSAIMASVLMALTLSCGLTAVADYDEPVDAYGSHSGNATITCKMSNESTLLDRTVDVVILWSDMDLEYFCVGTETWDNKSHTIVTAWDLSKSKWVTESGTVSVKNNGEIGVYVDVEVDTDNCPASEYCDINYKAGWANPDEEYECVYMTVKENGPLANGTLKLKMEQSTSVAKITVHISSYLDN